MQPPDQHCLGAWLCSSWVGDPRPAPVTSGPVVLGAGMAEFTALERCRLNEPRNWPSGLGPDGLWLRKRPGVMDTQPQTVGLSGSQALQLDFRPRGPHTPPKAGGSTATGEPSQEALPGAEWQQGEQGPHHDGAGAGARGLPGAALSFASASLGACPKLLLVTWFLAPEPSPPHALVPDRKNASHVTGEWGRDMVGE